MKVRNKGRRISAIAACTVALAAVCTVYFVLSDAADTDATASHIVQGRSLAGVKALIGAEGGEITHELGVIPAVAADLTAGQVEELRRHRDVRRVYANDAVEAAGKPGKGGSSGGGPGTNGVNSIIDTYYASTVNGQVLHLLGIDGRGVGIAVLDTGLWKHGAIKLDSSGNVRIRAVYDAINDVVPTSPLSGDDPGGHGLHVASIAVSSPMTPEGLYNGIAPGAHLVSVRAFDEYGQGTYADVISAIDWVVAHRDAHDIRILNLSLSAMPQSYYWDDPINQAVMVAWQNGIFVVAAAGSRGPDPMTGGVPGNVPYVMTVGAMSDNYTPADPSDDILASFSSAGPTQEGFVKPEIVAPGGHMLGLVQGNSVLATSYPSYFYNSLYFEMSGTSQAMAVVTGVAALVLQALPTLTVDELKCKLMAGARPGSERVRGKEVLAYSVFQQGAGRVDAYRSLLTSELDCANRGLDIDADVAGLMHFGGPADMNTDGSFYLRGDLDPDEGGYTWSEGYTSTDGYLWTDALTEMASMASWVDPECLLERAFSSSQARATFAPARRGLFFYKRVM